MSATWAPRRASNSRDRVIRSWKWTADSIPGRHTNSRSQNNPGTRLRRGTRKSSTQSNMSIVATTGLFSKSVLALLAINSLFLIANGLFMLIDPKAWFLFIPGVKFTGGFNQHFIRDIGLIQIFLGGAFVVGIVRPAVRLELWVAATIWLIAHSFFHFWEVAVGICGPSTILRDFPVVTLPALVGIVATAWAFRIKMRPERSAFGR